MVWKTLRNITLAITMAVGAYGCNAADRDKVIPQLDGSVQPGDMDPHNRDGGTPDGGVCGSALTDIFEKAQADTYEHLDDQILSSGGRLGDVFYGANVAVSSAKFDSLFYADGSPVREAMEQDITALMPACDAASVSEEISDLIAGRQPGTEGFVPAEDNAAYAKDSGDSTIFCVKGEEERKPTAYCSTTLPLTTRAVITYGGGI
jgi:hypothetical protein